MTIRPVASNLFISGHTRGLAPEQSLALLSEHHITRVICLAPRPDALLATHMISKRLCYDHIPLPDGKYIPDLVRDLAHGIALDTRPTLLHCNAGRNRAPFIAALVMMYRGQSAPEAIAHLRSLRDTALANPYFVDFLLKESP